MRGSWVIGWDDGRLAELRQDDYDCVFFLPFYSVLLLKMYKYDEI